MISRISDFTTTLRPQGVSVKSDIHDGIGALLSQVFEDTPLDDIQPRLAFPLMLRFAGRRARSRVNSSERRAYVQVTG